MNKLPENTIDALPGDAEIESRSRAIFKNACENTDSYHALRLGMARRKAAHVGAARVTSRVWAPLASAVACCALVIGVVWMNPARQTAPAATAMSSTPIATGSAAPEETTPEIGSTQMEMVQDLDFYRWLATQPAVASARNRSAR
jgi:hypothetical protein